MDIHEELRSGAISGGARIQSVHDEHAVCRRALHLDIHMDLSNHIRTGYVVDLSCHYQHIFIIMHHI